MLAGAPTMMPVVARASDVPRIALAADGRGAASWPILSSWCRPWVPCTTGHRPMLRAAPATLAGPAAASSSRSSSTRCSSGRTRISTATRARWTRTWPSAPDEGADLVFAPAAAEMYPAASPRSPSTRARPGNGLEGEFRPGFFDGVLTVVLKLLHLTRPAVAVFGQKDAQQLALVRRMVTDLNLDVVIEPVPTVRDADGLATSSRNRYLSAAERADGAAPAARLCRPGRRPRTAARRRCWPRPARYWPPNPPWPWTTWRWSTRGRSGRRGRLQPGPVLLVAAARVGGTRLIDNVALVLPAEGAGDAAHD